MAPFRRNLGEEKASEETKGKGMSGNVNKKKRGSFPYFLKACTQPERREKKRKTSALPNGKGLNEKIERKGGGRGKKK